MLTEAEAKTKWCPFAQVTLSGVAPGAPSGNRVQFHERDKAGIVETMLGSNCIGTECMAWRSHADPAFEREADEAFRRDGRRLTDNRNMGFCGLAGRPS